MTVIVESGEGDIMLYCKGADEIVYSKIDEYTLNTAKEINETFAKSGFRTLIMGKKQITNVNIYFLFSLYSVNGLRSIMIF